MATRFIPIIARRQYPDVAEVPFLDKPVTGMFRDALSRPLHDLRVSVTDRCNFRCVYCMPQEVFGKDYSFLPHSALLSFEEITRIAKIFVAHGVRKIRLTGGEPLLRKNVEQLIEALSALCTPDGEAIDLTLTTNASLLAKKARGLKDAGLRRVTVSLDALDENVFRRMNDVDFPVSDVLNGIDAAHAAGLGPIKINMVVKVGMNDRQILPMARHFKGSPFTLRFIEYMDVGASNGWKMNEVVPSAEVIRRIDAEMPLEEIEPNYSGETAERWRYKDGSGEIGVISSVTRAFCRDCTRARLSTEGRLYTCLFASSGHDLRALLRNGCSDEDFACAITHIWRQRADRYSDMRATPMDKPGAVASKVEMSYIGG